MIQANRNMPNFRAALSACIIAVGLLLQLDGVAAPDAFPADVDPMSRTSSQLRLEVADDLVTLRAHNARLRDILETLAVRIDVLFASDTPLGDRLTLELDRRPLYEALAQILRGRSFLFHQAASASSRTGAETRRRSGVLRVFAERPINTDIGNRGEPSAAREALEAELMNGDVGGRQNAVKLARKLGKEEALAPLSLALTDNNAKVRVQAIYGLAELGGQEAVDVLAAALRDENAGVRAEAAYALGAIGDSAAVQFLEQALGDTDPDVRESAIDALASIGGTTSSAALAIALRDPDPFLRLEAIGALSTIHESTAIGLLNEALVDDDENVRQAARDALEELSRQDPEPVFRTSTARDEAGRRNAKSASRSLSE